MPKEKEIIDKEEGAGQNRGRVYFTRMVSDTVSLWRPRARRAERTLRPLLLLIRSRKPCLFTFFLREG